MALKLTKNNAVELLGHPPRNDQMFKNIEKLMYELYAELKISRWRFAYDNAVRTYGLTYYAQRRITLSTRMVREESAEQVADTILHELAHVLTRYDPRFKPTGKNKDMPHGELWKSHATALGALPRASVPLNPEQKHERKQHLAKRKVLRNAHLLKVAQGVSVEAMKHRKILGTHKRELELEVGSIFFHREAMWKVHKINRTLVVASIEVMDKSSDFYAKMPLKQKRNYHKYTWDVPMVIARAGLVN